MEPPVVVAADRPIVERVEVIPSSTDSIPTPDHRAARRARWTRLVTARRPHLGGHALGSCIRCGETVPNDAHAVRYGGDVFHASCALYTPRERR